MADRKTQILAAAAKAFSQEGFDGVTVRQIAEACGISEPAVYRHFTSKESIYEAVLDSIEKRLDCEPLFERLTGSDDVESMLSEIAMHVVEFFGKNDDIQRLMLYSSLSQHSKAKQVYNLTRGRYVQFLKTELERLKETGKIHAVHPEITARCFVGMVFDCSLCNTLWRKTFGVQFEPEETIANNIPIYVRGLKKTT